MGADADLGRLTLRQAQALFNAQNREIRLARSAAEATQADVASAAARPNPILSIGSSSVSPSAGLGAGNPFNKRVDTTIGVSQLFERGGKRELRTAAARFGAAAARNDQAEVARQQRLALDTAYYDLVLAQARVEVTESTAALFGKAMEAANRRLEAGDISPTDLARISVDALRAQNDVRSARVDRQRAQLVLAYLIGADKSAARLHAADGWPRTPPALRNIEIERVLARRADVQAAVDRVQAATKTRDLALALRTRDVVAGVQYERYPGDVSNNSYGVTVSVPLFTSYYYQGEIRRAAVELEAAEENLGLVRARARAEINRSVADVTAAADRAQRFRNVLLADAEKAAKGAEFAYGHGAIGVMDLLDARRQLYATQLEAIATEADYAKALAQWRAATAATAYVGQQ